MPAFFFITGFCTTFDVDFKTFLIKSFKTILLPGIVINSAIEIIDLFNYASTFVWGAKTFIKSRLLTVTGEWFLPALFLSRIICWFLHKYIKNNYFQIIISAFCLIVGIYLYNDATQVYNIWYFKHTLMICIFMVLGCMCKGKQLSKKLIAICLLLYLGSLLVCAAMSIEVPRITNRIILPYSSILLLLVMSFSGIALLFYFSEKLTNHKSISSTLEYMGKTSLVIYLIHFPMYRIFIRLYSPILSGGGSISMVLFIILTILSVLVSSIMLAWLFNTKYLRWILGKF